MQKEHVERAMPFLGQLRRLEHCCAGAVNLVCEAENAQGEFIVKFYDQRFKDQVEVQTALLEKLRLPVPHPMRFEGKLFFPIGNRLGVVYPKLSGETKKAFAVEELQQVGAFLGAFHTLPDAQKFKGPERKLYDLSDDRIASIVELAMNAGLPRQELLHEGSALLKNLRLPSALPTGAVHVDVKPDNILFQAGQLSGVLDFDNMHRGVFLVDLAKAMMWFGMKGKTFNLGTARAVLKGYETARPLNPEEKVLLTKALHFAFVSHIVVDFEMRALRFTTEEYFAYITGDFYSAYLAFRALPEAEVKEGLGV
jgi:homoserine kinase type II